MAVGLVPESQDEEKYVLPGSATARDREKQVVEEESVDAEEMRILELALQSAAPARRLTNLQVRNVRWCDSPATGPTSSV